MRLKSVINALIVLLLLCPFAFAEGASKTENGTKIDLSLAKKWEFSLAPMYLWATSLDGSMTVKGRTVILELPFKDAVENLDGALSFHFEGLHTLEHFGFFVDLMYLHLNPLDETTPAGYNIGIDVTQMLVELAGFYRLPKGAHTFDLLAGLRYASLEGELRLRRLPDVSKRVDWIDPMFGARWQWQMAEKWHLHLRGDVAGFGFGSDFSGNLIGLIEFKPWKHVSFGLGYRVFYQDYSNGSGENRSSYDATMHGPILGLNITW